MKHILDYIEEECAGCATPGNTMGMGNPMPPSEEAPGSEPLCGKCKKEKKKKKVTESILDDDLDGNENAMKKKWVMDHLQSYKEEVDRHFEIDKNGLISIDYVVRLELHEDMPDYIQFGDVYEIEYVLFDKNRKTYKINLPQSTQSIKVMSHSDRKIPVTLTMDNVKGTECTELLITGVYDDIVFPKNMKVIQSIDLERTSSVNFTNIDFPKSREISLPREDVVNFMKKMFHIKSDRIKF